MMTLASLAAATLDADQGAENISARLFRALANDAGALLALSRCSSLLHRFARCSPHFFEEIYCKLPPRGEPALDLFKFFEDNPGLAAAVRSITFSAAPGNEHGGPSVNANWLRYHLPLFRHLSIIRLRRVPWSKLVSLPANLELVAPRQFLPPVHTIHTSSVDICPWSLLDFTSFLHLFPNITELAIASSCQHCATAPIERTNLTDDRVHRLLIEDVAPAARARSLKTPLDFLRKYPALLHLAVQRIAPSELTKVATFIDHAVQKLQTCIIHVNNQLDATRDRPLWLSVPISHLDNLWLFALYLPQTASLRNDATYTAMLCDTILYNLPMTLECCQLVFGDPDKLPTTDGIDATDRIHAMPWDDLFRCIALDKDRHCCVRLTYATWSTEDKRSLKLLARTYGIKVEFLSGPIDFADAAAYCPSSSWPQRRTVV
ncbi:hypothetical protein PsYK624_129500 [Phanerochaete sordida]|uniref:Uncharacterized protein n=1 Tax=Phanerochaete sordida TaxID=48140 RepID=A0A9P3LJJ9_9APHY|nr:hypothetical protein PsYK624_129500 [Phanerochaete sordida]